MSSTAARALSGFPKVAIDSPSENSVVSQDDKKQALPQPQQPTDEELMQSLRHGDLDALSHIYRRYARLVMSICLRVLRDSSEAEDLVQDVFVLLHRKRELFDPAKGCARGWLIQVAYHQSLNRRDYLNARRYYHHDAPDTPGAEIAALRTVTDGLGDMLYWSSRLDGLLDKLTADQKLALQLYYFEGYTVEEISQKMAHTVGNVRNHIYRGLERMSGALANGRDHESDHESTHP